MSFDAHKNFAYTTVVTPPSPATSGTSLTVAANTATRFPAVPFNAVICPFGQVPLPSNAEVVRVTNITSDTLTITRTQETSNARTVGAGDQIFAAITAKTITDIETAASAVTGNYVKISEYVTQADPNTTEGSLTIQFPIIKYGFTATISPDFGGGYFMSTDEENMYMQGPHIQFQSADVDFVYGFRSGGLITQLGNLDLTGNITQTGNINAIGEFNFSRSYSGGANELSLLNADGGSPALYAILREDSASDKHARINISAIIGVELSTAGANGTDFAKFQVDDDAKFFQFGFGETGDVGPVTIKSGKLGVNTYTPTEALHIVGNALFISSIAVKNGTASTTLTQSGSDFTILNGNGHISIGTDNGSDLRLANYGSIKIGDVNNDSAGVYMTYNSNDNELIIPGGFSLIVGGEQILTGQQASVANATGTGDIVARFNELLTRIRTHGLIANS